MAHHLRSLLLIALIYAPAGFTSLHSARQRVMRNRR